MDINLYTMELLRYINKFVYGENILIFCKSNELHKRNNPAKICANGNIEWWFDGKQRYKNGPVIIWSNDNYGCWVFGNWHRENCLAKQFWMNGSIK